MQDQDTDLRAEMDSQPEPMEIVSLNFDALDVAELENRLAATSFWAEDGWGCGCDGCGALMTCGPYCV